MVPVNFVFIAFSLCENDIFEFHQLKTEYRWGEKIYAIWQCIEYNY